MRQERFGASRSLRSDSERYKYVLLQDSEARADASLRRGSSYNNYYNNPSYGKATSRDMKACTIVQGILESAHIELTQCLHGIHLVLTWNSPSAYIALTTEHCHSRGYQRSILRQGGRRMPQEGRQQAQTERELSGHKGVTRRPQIKR